MNSSIKSVSLRSVCEMVSEVDRLMDRNKVKFKSDESNVSNETESLSSSSGEEENRKKMMIRGKEKKSSSCVKYLQNWPHSHLKFHFVSEKKKYEELSIRQD